jgi:molybdate transport system substrate-binding protein
LEPALTAALNLWRANGGEQLNVTFATAPRIAARLAGGEAPDLVLAPRGMIEELGRAGRLKDAPVQLGAIGVGIAMRNDAHDPGIHDEASFRAAILLAPAIVFNRASTGIYVEGLLDRMGLAEPMAARILRFADGDTVLKRIAVGSGQEIGFAAMTEILLFRENGVRLVGPLPEPLQNRTSYAAGRLGGMGDAARRLLTFLGSAEARKAMALAGVE